MRAGSVTTVAYFVIGATMRTISASWSPSWRSPATGVAARQVSRLTCPDSTIIGIESVQAPNTPFIALMPPGPVVTMQTPGRSARRA